MVTNESDQQVDVDNEDHRVDVHGKYKRGRAPRSDDPDPKRARTGESRSRYTNPSASPIPARYVQWYTLNAPLVQGFPRV